MERASSSNSGKSNKGCSRGHWRPSEDERLEQLVKQYGPKNWNFISEHLEGRSGKSCRLRWYNQLDPKIIKKPFSDEEEEKLLALHKVKGNKWAAIAKSFPGKTDNAVKKHFHVLMSRRKREHLALFGDTFGHNSSLDFKGMFGTYASEKPTLWTPLIGSSTITSSFDVSSVVNKTHKDSNVVVSSSAKEKTLFDLDHFSSRATASILGSYHSFTAPGLPTVCKVVPISIPHKISNYSCGHRTEDSIKIGKHPRESFTTLSKFIGINERKQVETLDLKQKGVSFIDFLGVGTSSTHP